MYKKDMDWGTPHNAYCEGYHQCLQYKTRCDELFTVDNVQGKLRGLFKMDY